MSDDQFPRAASSQNTHSASLNDDFEPPSTSNLYKFGLAEGDRDRLIAQTYLFTQYLREQAKIFIEIPVKRILDLGCGEGQLTVTLGRIFPDAEVIGIDSDEKAISEAQKNLQKLTIPPKNVQYVVGDAQEQLPDGPFDLIYASLVLVYVPKLDRALQMIFQRLSPGGYVWIKDGHPDWVKAIEHPAFYRLIGMAADAFTKMGGHPALGAELPDILASIGFTDIRFESEIYPMTNQTLPGRIAISVVLGGLYNFRKVLAKTENVPEEEILQLHKELTDDIHNLKGQWKLANVLARRPQ